MCLIVDTNFKTRVPFEEWTCRTWLWNTPRARLVVGGLLLEELAQDHDIRKFLAELDRAGRLRKFDRQEIESAGKKVKVRLRSNDPHVIGLALASGARTLATFDAALRADFNDKRVIDNPRGAIFQNLPQHRKLLRHTKSCGIK